MLFNPIFIALVLLLLLAFASIKVLFEYERGVVFLLGRFQAVKGPGLIIVVPVIQQMRRVNPCPRIVGMARQGDVSRPDFQV